MFIQSEENYMTNYKINIANGKIETLGGLLENVEFVPIAMRKERILFAPYKKGEKNQYFCRSKDSINPIDGIQKRGCFCSQCSESKWREKQPPNCMEVYCVYGYDLVQGILFCFKVKRTGVKGLRAFLSSISSSGREFCKASLSTRREENYFVPVFKMIGAIEDVSNISFYRNLMKQFTKEQQPKVEEEKFYEDNGIPIETPMPNFVQETTLEEQPPF